MTIILHSKKLPWVVWSNGEKTLITLGVRNDFIKFI